MKVSVDFAGPIDVFNDASAGFELRNVGFVARSVLIEEETRRFRLSYLFEDGGESVGAIEEKDENGNVHEQR